MWGLCMGVGFGVVLLYRHVWGVICLVVWCGWVIVVLECYIVFFWVGLGLCVGCG